MAGMLADRGDLEEAIALLATGGKSLRHPDACHLRQWYALGDLYERAGDLPRARELFERVASFAPELFDVDGCACAALPLSLHQPGISADGSTVTFVDRVGLVGLPNSGKSSLFNALTGGNAVVAPHPFSTTETEIGVAHVPDPPRRRACEDEPQPQERATPASRSSTSPR